MLCKFVSAVALLSAVGLCDEDGDKFHEDNADSGDNEGSFGLTFYQENSRPMVIFYNSMDDRDAKYCLTFEEMYEVSSWTMGGDFDEVYKLQANEVDWNYEQNTDATDTTWDYRIVSAPGDISDKVGSIAFTFRGEHVTLVDETNQDFALKFDIAINGFTWDSELNKVAFSFKLRQCEDEYSDGEHSNDGDDDDTTMAPVRRRYVRRLSEGEEEEAGDDSGVASRDDPAGLDSQDSHEFNLDAAFFTVERTATNGEGATVAVTLDYDDGGDRIYVVFDYFGDSVTLDPTAGVSSSKLGLNSASALSFAASMIACLIAILFA